MSAWYPKFCQVQSGRFLSLAVRFAPKYPSARLQFVLADAWPRAANEGYITFDSSRALSRYDLGQQLFPLSTNFSPCNAMSVLVSVGYCFLKDATAA